MKRRLVKSHKRVATYRYRSAVTGRFITKAKYEANPNTTIRQRIRSSK